MARRYEFYVRVAKTISHSFAVLTCEILFLPQEHKVHIFELTCNALFIIWTYWWRRFWWFSEDFRPLSEDFRRFSKIVLRVRRAFPNIFQEFPKIPEDVLRLPKTIEEDPKMFRWYTNYFKYNLRDKLYINEIIDIFTCENILSFLWICYHSVYHWLLSNKSLYLSKKWVTIVLHLPLYPMQGELQSFFKEKALLGFDYLMHDSLKKNTTIRDKKSN